MQGRDVFTHCCLFIDSISCFRPWSVGVEMNNLENIAAVVCETYGLPAVDKPPFYFCTQLLQFEFCLY